MRSAPLLLGTGLVLGVVAMYVIRDGDDAASNDTPVFDDVAPQSVGVRGSTAPRIDFLELVTGPADVGRRAALYRLAAEADRATIESLAAQIAVLPKLPSRALALEALLTRYAELDATAATALARELGLEAEVISPMFVTWARRDASGALRAREALRRQLRSGRVKRFWNECS
jgi:hypothetical protein